MEQKDTGPEILIKQALQNDGKDELQLAKTMIESGLRALNLGYFKASDIIPRMLDVVGKY
jgi:hypothetical protein